MKDSNDLSRKEHHEQQTYICDEYKCEKQLSSKRNLLNHINVVHLQIKKYECDKCDYKFGQKDFLIKHQLRIHGNGIRHLKCHQCPKTYKWETDFNRHMEKHSDKKYQCDSCVKQFVEKRKLQYHIKSVHLKVNYMCKAVNCYYGSFSLLTLKAHVLKVHDVENDFKCNLCQYRTVRSGDLKRHLKTKHLKGEKIQCPLCEYQCVRKDNLIQHQKKVHPSVNISCDICLTYKSKNKKELKEHKKSCKVLEALNSKLQTHLQWCQTNITTD